MALVLVGNSETIGRHIDMTDKIARKAKPKILRGGNF